MKKTKKAWTSFEKGEIDLSNIRLTRKDVLNCIFYVVPRPMIRSKTMKEAGYHVRRITISWEE